MQKPNKKAESFVIFNWTDKGEAYTAFFCSQSDDICTMSILISLRSGKPAFSGCWVMSSPERRKRMTEEAEN